MTRRKAPLPRATRSYLPVGFVHQLLPGHYVNFSIKISDVAWPVSHVAVSAPFRAKVAMAAPVSHVAVSAPFKAKVTFSPAPPASKSIAYVALFKPRSYAIARNAQDHALGVIL